MEPALAHGCQGCWLGQVTCTVDMASKERRPGPARQKSGRQASAERKKDRKRGRRQPGLAVVVDKQASPRRWTGSKDPARSIIIFLRYHDDGWQQAVEHLSEFQAISSHNHRPRPLCLSVLLVGFASGLSRRSSRRRNGRRRVHAAWARSHGRDSSNTTRQCGIKARQIVQRRNRQLTDGYMDGGTRPWVVYYPSYR